MFFEPSTGLGLRHDRQNLNRLFCHVVKHSDVVTDSKTVLRSREPSQTLDPALARLGWFMPQVLFDGIAHRGADIRRDINQVFDRFRSQKYIVSHSGYIVARFWPRKKPCRQESLHEADDHFCSTADLTSLRSCKMAFLITPLN